MSEQRINKTIIINRAVPGSGKTTISNCLIKYLESKGISTAIHSTDEFFITEDRRYDFQIEKLYAYHQSNLSDFVESLKVDIPVVICDNINIAPWQTKPYTDVARDYGYRIIFLNFFPRELEKHIESQRVTPDKPDAHGVPEDVLVRFIEEYNIYNSLLDKSFSINHDIHIDYFWDSKNNIRVASGRPSEHFDSDTIINILPHDYHELKKTDW